MIALRSYQTKVVADFYSAVANGCRKIIVVAPTGSGKTIIGGDIIRSYTSRLRPALVLAHTREIVKQTSAKLFANQIPHGIIMAGVRPRPLELVQLATVQTLWARFETIERPPADLIVIDECHHATARTWSAIIDQYPDAVRLGLSATPSRGDGRGLGGIFDAIIETPQVRELISDGFLVPTRVYAPVNPDLQGVETRHGDYVESQLAIRMDRPKLIGDIVTHWFKYGENRRTVAFCSGVGHSVHLRDEFIKSGVKAEHIDGSTPKDERDATLLRLASGEVTLVTNCMVLTEGWDMPDVGCAILARPTRKMGLYRQMIGRVLRPAPGKPDAIILDHSGAVFKHGFAEDRVEWTLDPDLRAQSPVHNKRCRDHVTPVLECSQCGAMREGGKPCPHCGFMPMRPPRPFLVADGDLGLVNAQRQAKGSPVDSGIRTQWHGMLAWIAAERSYKPGWVAYKFKEKFGHWPPTQSAIPITPSPEVRAWVRSRNIAYAKARTAS